MPAFLDGSSKTAGARNVPRNPKSPENPLNIIVMGWQVKWGSAGMAVYERDKLK
jgi:hypothetical protein